MRGSPTFNLPPSNFQAINLWRHAEQRDTNPISGLGMRRYDAFLNNWTQTIICGVICV